MATTKRQTIDRDQRRRVLQAHKAHAAPAEIAAISGLTVDQVRMVITREGPRRRGR